MTAREKLLAVVAMDPKRPSVGAAAPVALLALEAAAEIAERIEESLPTATLIPDTIRALAAEVENAE